MPSTNNDNKLAVFEAATTLVAAHGIRATTASIAKLARVPEDTLSNYFSSKTALLNSLFLTLYKELVSVMRESHDLGLPFQDRIQIIWNSYIDWSVRFPKKSRALNQLNLCESISDETRATEFLLFPDVEVAEHYAANDIFIAHNPEFADAMMIAVAETTARFTLQDPSRAADYKLSGFKIFKRMLYDQ